MRGGLGNLMKQAQEMQERMKQVQEELATLEVEGRSGGGMVNVVMTCRHDVRSVTIDPALLQDDKEVLEDLIAAAMNDAVQRVEKTVQEKMGDMTGGMNIPGLNLPI
ncbi:MAG: nucleoid-associated protein [marine bacterium B5-7]|nr:MAG: nucleoid-associated protein [marine bacterium B5-7]